MQIEEQLTKLKNTYESIATHDELAKGGWEDLTLRLGKQQTPAPANHRRVFLYASLGVFVLGGFIVVVHAAKPGDTFYALKKKTTSVVNAFIHTPLPSVTTVPKKLLLIKSSTPKTKQPTPSPTSSPEPTKQQTTRSHVLSETTKTQNPAQSLPSHGNKPITVPVSISPTPTRSQDNPSGGNGQGNGNSAQAHQNSQSSQSNPNNKKNSE